MKNEVNKVLFIVNKHSGGGFRPEVEGKIIEVCEQNDSECTIEYTQARGHGIELARQAVHENRFAKVVAVGGDGTINEVAQGLLHSSVPMGIIPKGSGNGLARHLQIPMTVAESVKTLFTGQEIAMDTFRLNGKLSLNVSGIGFDGHVANLFATNKKRGLQGYAKITAREFLKFREFEAEITLNRETIRRKAFIIAIANSSQYGNNARIAPAASVCDQLLHISLLKKVPLYRMDFIYQFLRGKVHESRYCETMETNKLTITVNAAVPFHIDGEPCGHADTFNIELLPASLRMVAPQSVNKP
jgi:YegS/Rv2252/BmrU family lipid kinase